MKKVICQEWTEFEAGWGLRPDGFTLHPNKSSYNSFVEKMKEHYGNKEYSHPEGDPFIALISEEEFKDVKLNSFVWKDRLYKPKKYDPLEDLD